MAMMQQSVHQSAESFCHLRAESKASTLVQNKLVLRLKSQIHPSGHEKQCQWHHDRTDTDDQVRK